MMSPRRASRILLLGALFYGSTSSAHVRMLVRNTNWYYTRHHVYIGIPARGAVGTTGMGRGATELRVGEGGVSFALEDAAGIWPPIAYNCPPRGEGGPETALDLTFGWVYVPDGLAWTQDGGRAYAQTFVAEGPELVSVRCRVASAPKPIEVTLHRDGPDGPQIGATHTFKAGGAAWGEVYWEPGDAPTTPGRTYCVVLRPADGGEWSPFVHAQGNCYEGGYAFVDGVPLPQTDLCLLISNPGDGYIRHVPFPNSARAAGEWSDVAHGQRFLARGANLILAFVELEHRKAHETKHGDPGVFLVIRRDGPDGEAIGPRMNIGALGGKPGDTNRRGVPYAPDSVPLQAGQTYFAGVETGDGEPLQECRVRARLYGELVAGSHPTVANIWTGRIFPDSIEIVWRKGNPSTATLEYGEPGGGVIGAAEEMGGEGWAVLTDLEPDTTYQFRLTASSPEGYRYTSPWYLVRTRAEDGTLGKVERVQRFGVFDPFFLPVAFAPPGTGRRDIEIEGRSVPMANAGFEDGTEGWSVSDGIDPATFEGNDRLRPRGGRRMCGWLRVPEGETRDSDFYKIDRITQEIGVTPGRWYQLSLWALTDEPDWTADQWHENTWSFPIHEPRCRNRVRGFADPEGGEEFGGANSTQWFSTAGRWRLITREFQARSDRVRIGAEFFHWGRRDWDAAFVDDVRLVELDEAPWDRTKP